MPELSMDEKLLSVRELADFLNVQEKTVYAWNSEGVGPKYFKIAGKTVRYRWSEVIAWLEAIESK